MLVVIGPDGVANQRVVLKDRPENNMKIHGVFLCGILIALSAFASNETNKESALERWHRLMAGPHVKRGNLPELKLEHTTAANASEAAEIKKLIASLANIDTPDYGLSGSMGGTAFAPLAESGKFTGGFLLTNHRLKTSDDFKKLVEFGPRALPFLLDALDDPTPTKLEMNHEGGFGGMFLCTELEGNPTNSLEQKAISALPRKDKIGNYDFAVDHYTVKVGDVCFVAIGQITGRAYQAVRYQPTAIIVINSPVKEKSLARAVREIWTSTNECQKLFDSLLFDYSTEGVFNGESLGGWSIASGLQCEAARRMLYYFPQETSPLIAERLSRLDVFKPDAGFTNIIKHEVSNGVRAKEFLAAVSWSDAPAVRREVLNVIKRTTDQDVLLAALGGVDASQKEVVKARLETMIDQLPPTEEGPFGDGYNLLVALGEKIGPESKPTFVRYLQNASLQRWRSMAKVLSETRTEWAAELLAPALTDKREFGWNYALVPGQNEPRRPIRVCDEAAEAISLHRPDLPFKMAGEHEDLDKQISQMLERIRAEKH